MDGFVENKLNISPCILETCDDNNCASGKWFCCHLKVGSSYCMDNSTLAKCSAECEKDRERALRISKKSGVNKRLETPIFLYFLGTFILF